MCPEFTGSPERGCSQVVVCVSSLRGRAETHTHTHTRGGGRQKENTCYSTEMPSGIRSLQTGAASETEPADWDSLDEEDPAVPADPVGPASR